MGRHAAPGDDEPDAGPVAAAPPDATERSGSRPSPAPRGRHSVPDDDDEDDGVGAVATAVTERLPAPPLVAEPDAPAQTVDRAVDAVSQKKEGATAADWRLLRSDSALRNRVVAAVVAPFVLFVFVLAVIGRLDAFAVWIWLPLITAGIGAGVLLDRAHAQGTKAAPGQTPVELARPPAGDESEPG